MAQPALDTLGRNPGFFLERAVPFGPALALAVIVVVGPPLVAWLLEVAVGLALPRARRPVHALLVGGFAGVSALAIVKQASDLGAAPLVVIGAAAAIVGTVGVLRSVIVRRFVRYSIVGPPLMAVLFLFASTAAPVFSTASGGSPATIGAPTRVVVLVFDELPLVSLLDGQGGVDGELYPGFADLAATSTWYRNTTTVAPYTEVAVPAILTGRYPPEPDAVPSLAAHPDNLFTLLRADYDLNVHEVVTRLCPGSCAVETPGLASLVRTTASLWRDRVAPDRPEPDFGRTKATIEVRRTTRTFLTSLTAATEPRLDFAHIMLPHEPFHYLGDFQDTLAPVKMPGAAYLRWTEGPGAEVARRRHLLQLQTADTVVAQTLDRLRDLGALDDTLLVVTADHGISFRPGEPLRSVSVANHTDIMWTPLFVHAPGQSNGTVDDRPARSIDVLPTMLELLDAETDVALDGRSLLGPPPNDDGDVRRLYQSGLTAFEPADVLRPPAGRDHLEFDGAAGFATVLATPGLPADGDPALRIYRIGEHGDLVGRSVAPLLDDRPSDHAASIVDRAERFANVDPRARTIPWVYNQVFFNGSTDPETIALLDQGIVIAVGRTAMLDADGHAFAMLLVPPALMLPGEHRLTVAIVRGSPDAPTLDPVLTG